MPNPLTKNFAYYSLGIILPGILSFLFIPIVVNIFHESAYAKYSLTLNTLQVVANFCYGWIGQSYIRFYSFYPEWFLQKALQLLRKSLLIGGIIFVLFQLFFVKNEWWQILITIPAFGFVVYYNFFILACQAQQKAKTVAFSELIRTGLNLALPLIAQLVLSKEYSFQILIISLTISFAIPIIFFYKKIKHVDTYKSSPNGLQTKEAINKTLQYGIPVAFFLSFSLALTLNDRFVIARLIDYDTAGKYASVYDIINRSITVICSPIVMTFYPHIAQLYNAGNKKDSFNSIKRALLIEAGMFAIGFAVISLAGIWAMNIIFKREVQSNELGMMMLIYTGVFFWQFAIMLQKPLEMIQKTRLMAIGVLISFILNLAANILLLKNNSSLIIPATTTVASSIFYITYVLFIIRKKYKLK